MTADGEKPLSWQSRSGCHAPRPPVSEGNESSESNLVPTAPPPPASWSVAVSWRRGAASRSG